MNSTRSQQTAGQIHAIMNVNNSVKALVIGFNSYKI